MTSDSNLPSPLHQHLLTLARYNAWATARLFDAVDTVPEEAYRRPVGLFFHSIHGTLNHLLVTEHLLWARRFREGVSPQVALNTEAESDRARLKQRLLQGASEWGPWLQALNVERLAGHLAYRTMRGQDVSLPFAPTLAHVFNHGTHHRGQVTAALTQLGTASPVIDLVFMLQAESQTP
jgi:uncharacterized damage-inducible protein DinB